MNQKALLNGKAPLVPLHETKLCLVYDREEAENAKKSFRIREAMLRVLYNHLFLKGREKSITDELDEQFEKIKRGYKRKMANKEIENIAKEVMKKD